MCKVLIKKGMIQKYSFPAKGQKMGSCINEPLRWEDAKIPMPIPSSGVINRVRRGYCKG